MGDLRRRADRVRLPTLLNLSLCTLSKGEHAAAEAYAREALTVDGRSVKGLYRLAKALGAQSKFEEARSSLERCLRLDPQNADALRALREVQSEDRRQREAQRRTYDGLFSDSRYAAAVDVEQRNVEREKRRQRKPLADALRQFCEQQMDSGADESGGGPSPSAADVSPYSVACLGVLDRWCSSGPSALEDDERRALETLVKRAAAAGRLDSQDQRSALDRHGLGGAFTRQAFEESMDAEESGRWAEQQRILRVKEIIAKTKNNETLSDEEHAQLRGYLDEEVSRLDTKGRAGGLSQEESFLLAKLREKRKQLDADEAVGQDRVQYIEGLMERMDMGRRVQVRERLRVMSMLEEEEERLQRKDDEQGLTSVELRLLTQLTAQRKEREKQKKEKELKQQLMDRKREQERANGGDIIV